MHGVDLGNEIAWNDSWLNTRDSEINQLAPSVPCNEEENSISNDEAEDDSQPQKELLFTTKELEHKATKTAEQSDSESEARFHWTWWGH